MIFPVESISISPGHLRKPNDLFDLNPARSSRGIKMNYWLFCFPFLSCEHSTPGTQRTGLPNPPSAIAHQTDWIGPHKKVEFPVFGQSNNVSPFLLLLSLSIAVPFCFGFQSPTGPTIRSGRLAPIRTLRRSAASLKERAASVKSREPPSQSQNH